MRVIKGEVNGAEVILRDESSSDVKTVVTYINGDKTAEVVFNTAEEIAQFMDFSVAVLEDYSILPKMKLAANILIGSALTSYINDRAKESKRRDGVLKMLDDMHADIQRMEKELSNPLTTPLVFDKWSLNQKKKAMQDVIDEERKMLDAHMMQHKTTEELMGEHDANSHGDELRKAMRDYKMPKDLEEMLEKIFSSSRPSLSKIIDDEINALIGGSFNASPRMYTMEEIRAKAYERAEDDPELTGATTPSSDAPIASDQSQEDQYAARRAGDDASGAEFYLNCKTCDVTVCKSRRWARVQSEGTNE